MKLSLVTLAALLFSLNVFSASLVEVESLYSMKNIEENLSQRIKMVGILSRERVL